MDGRLEHKIQTEMNILNILNTLPEYLEDYYLFLSATKEPKTCQEYLRKIRFFLCHVNKEITRITEKDINKFFLFIQIKECNGIKSETSFSYRKSYYAILSSLFYYLYRNNIINNNPMEYITRPKETDNVEHILLNEHDLNKILIQVNKGTNNAIANSRQVKWKERDRAILMLFMNTGMRETALSEININDLDLENNVLRIIDKGHKYHEYVINDKLLEDLILWLDKREILLGNKEEDALFISNRRKRITSKSISNIVKKYSKDGIGDEVSPHKLRSAFCTILYEETGDIEFVRECVGHSNIATTQRYIVKGKDIKKKAANIMCNKIG